MFKKYLILLFFFALPLFSSAQNASWQKISYQKAQVLKVEETVEKNENQVISQQKIKIKILSGPHKNEEREIENILSNNPLDLKIKAGDKILIYEEQNNDQDIIQIQSFYVLPILIFFIFLFLIVLLAIGGKQGAKAIISLSLSVFLIFKILIPQMLQGKNPIYLSLAIAAIIAIITLLLISGLKKKTFAAILGTISGVAVAAGLASIFGNLAHLNGLSDEHARTLFSSFPYLNFKGILFAGIIIGALGAVMDVAMSISSSIAEVKKAQPEIKKTALIKSGMAVGKDIMGTMSNTLIFAYVGSSLFLLLLFNQYGESYLKFLNFNYVAEEIIRSIAGSIGLILAIPITAIIASYLENK